jgi:serine protease Do
MFTFKRAHATALAFVGMGVLLGAAGTGVLRGLPASSSTYAQRPTQIADVVNRVRPAVVSIRVKSNAESTGAQGGLNPFEGTPLAPFFKGQPPRGQSPEAQPEPGVPQNGHQVQEEGSGFFISPDGYVVTANHVVSNAVKIELITQDDETLEAKLVGADAKTDVALLKVDGRTNFPFVAFASGQPRIGDWVIAMGNPFGLGGSVTAGIVSGQSRNIGLGPYDEYLQIDAAVNKGNSGGPTFNLDGEVIGVNSAIVSSSPAGGSVGIAFAIPAPTVQKVTSTLKDKGRIVRGWLGVSIQAVTREIADSIGVEGAKGALIAAPEPGSPAAAAGLKTGDVITELNGLQIRDDRRLSQNIAALDPGTEVTLTLLRGGKAENMKITLGTQPDEQQARNDAPAADHAAAAKKEDLGLKLAPAATVEGYGNRGLAVTGVEPDSRGNDLGFVVGDVILQAGGKDLTQPGQLTHAMDEAKASGRKHALVLVQREDKQLFVAVPIAAG